MADKWQEAAERWAQSFPELEAWVRAHPRATIVLGIKATLEAMEIGRTPELESQLEAYGRAALAAAREWAASQANDPRRVADIKSENEKLRGVIEMLRTPTVDAFVSEFERALSDPEARGFFPAWLKKDIPNEASPDSVVRVLLEHFALFAAKLADRSLREQKRAHLISVEQSITTRRALTREHDEGKESKGADDHVNV